MTPQAANRQDQPLALLEPEVIERVRQLELFSRFRVEGFLGGSNRSPDQGSSSDFLRHRQYLPGDNPKYLDWRVYGRTERLFIREQEELTNTRLSVVLDVSNSMGYCDRSLSKHGFAIRSAAVLCYLAFGRQDTFSLTTFNTGKAHHVPFGSGRSHLLRVLHALVSAAPGNGTDFRHALGQSTAHIRRKGLTIVLSDFMDDAEPIARTLSRLRFEGSDVIAMGVFDPMERSLDFSSITRFHDLEDNQILVVDPQLIQNAYQREFDAHQQEIRQACHRYGFEYTALPVGDDYDVALGAYLRHRMERFT